MGTERFGSVICCSTVEMRLGTITVANLFPKGNAPRRKKNYFFLLGALPLVNAASPLTISIDKKKISSGTQGIVFLAMRSSSRPKGCTTEKSYAVENGLFLSFKTVGFRRRIMQSQFQRQSVAVKSC